MSAPAVEPGDPYSPDSRPLRHKTLSAYYPQLFTLRTYLSSFNALYYHSDPEEYRLLLDETVCAPRMDAPDMPPAGPVTESQQEAIDRILRDLGRRWGAREVLVNGNGRSSELPINLSRPGAGSLFVGTPSTALRALPWKILRSRLGDAAFRHLFLYTSLFLPLGNNCYVQLCGVPIHDLYNHGTNATMAREEGTKRKRGKVEARPHATRRKAEVKEGQTSKPGPASKNLNRQRLFYGRPQRSARGKILYGLPSDHILNKCCARSADLPSDNACLDLLRAIFPTMTDKRNPAQVKGSPQRVHSMVGAMREMLVRHVRTDYEALLRRCLNRLKDVELDAYPRLGNEELTPLPESGMSLRAGALGSSGQEMDIDSEPGPSTPGPPLQPVSQTQVCRFAISVLRSILSPFLSGSKHNLDILARNARTLINAKMYEPISLHTLVQGLRVNDFVWLAVGEGSRVPPQEAAKRRKLVEQFVYWLFDELVIPLLRASFYVTETATTRYETVYFAHEAWAMTTEPHLRELEATLLEELDQEKSQKAQNAPLGVSAVRLIPKPNGFRPIVNLGRQIRTKNAMGVSRAPGKPLTANEALRNVHQILTFEKNRHRSELGSCLFGTNEIFGPLQELKGELIHKHGKLPKLYFVKMDIKAAFDTIKQDKVLDVVGQLLDKDHSYCLLLYSLLLPPASKASQASSRRLFKTRAAIADATLSTFGTHAHLVAKPMRNAVLVDLMRRREVTRHQCMELLRTHIQQNMWQVGTKLFRQKTGIPQGSTISSLLCSFFYSFMEAEHLAWTRRTGTRLLRYIDDFLLITDDYGVARRFVDVMSRGFPEYGAFVSPGKTLLSFEHAAAGQAAPVAGLVADGACYFPYCGFLIDSKTLDIRIDHVRLTTGLTRQSFALRSSRNRGASFVGWLSRQLENRNHVAYLDTAHNSLYTVYLNIFVNFALTSMKIPHYFGSATLGIRRSMLVYNWLCMAADYTHSAGRARVRHAARGNNVEHFDVRRKPFVYIAKMAMLRVLARRARFADIVDRLKRDVESRENSAVAVECADVVAQGWEMVKRAKF